MASTLVTSIRNLHQRKGRKRRGLTLAEGVRVVISVDCGIRAPEAALRARELGLDLIITDHHEPDTELPKALAVLNPRRPDCAYPFKGLSGVGVA